MSGRSSLVQLQELEDQGRKLVEHIGALEGAGHIGNEHESCLAKLASVIHQQTRLRIVHQQKIARNERQRASVDIESRDSSGIRTEYGGTIFRSRLEAHWAAWFDLVGIAWEYEPFDLESYIPDFVVHSYGGSMLVEVKPALRSSDLWPAAHKIDDSGWEEAAMVVGANLTTALERVFEEYDWIWRDSAGFPGSVREARRLWREAGNIVQWKPRG